MSILFCTPAYGGQVFVPFVSSMRAAEEAMRSTGLKYDWLFRYNESLVQRARNGMAAKFLWETSFKRLMFVDADVEFTADDIAKLWNLDTDVAVGIYAMKKPGQKIYAGWKDGELVDLDDMKRIETLDYAGTGFMMIKRGVFEDFCAKWPEREHREREDGGKSFRWFDPRQKEDIYLSEDYAFCEDLRKLGGKIVCDTTIRLKHYGLYPYGA